jgi:peroxiredoxin
MAAPDFTLDSAQGRPVSLGDYRGKLNVVLVFYRGKT